MGLVATLALVACSALATVGENDMAAVKLQATK